MKRGFFVCISLRRALLVNLKCFMKHEDIAVQKDVIRGEEPKRLYFDLEISPMLAWSFNAYEGNALHIEQDPKILSVAWQWEGEKEVKVKCLADFDGYKPNRFKIDDKKLVYKVHQILTDADVIIGHNSDNFDIKIANARFFHYGLEPIAETKRFDTLKKARKYFKMPKNTLDDIYRYVFKQQGKATVKYSDVLWDCLDGNESAWRAMKKYNQQDVVITRELYLRMRGFDKNHPNLSFFTRRPNECKTCLSTKIHRRGRKWMRGGLRWEWRCETCKASHYSEIIKDGIDKIKSYD